jgi:hypothetical protein
MNDDFKKQIKILIDYFVQFLCHYFRDFSLGVGREIRMKTDVIFLPFVCARFFQSGDNPQS